MGNADNFWAKQINNSNDAPIMQYKPFYMNQIQTHNAVLFELWFELNEIKKVYCFDRCLKAENKQFASKHTEMPLLWQLAPAPL